MDIVIATENVHKVREIKSLVKGYGLFDIYTLADFPEYAPPAETGTTFRENAELKAVHAAQSLNMWALADDSGLVVPALKGAPGIYSARYSGEGATDKDNRKKLLKEMESLEGIDRTAYFECVIALASPAKLKKTVTGICEGEILREERGRSGFGYDTLFVKHEYNQTFGELEERVKNQVSHRAKALEKLRITLESIVQEPSGFKSL